MHDHCSHQTRLYGSQPEGDYDVISCEKAKVAGQDILIKSSRKFLQPAVAESELTIFGFCTEVECFGLLDQDNSYSNTANAENKKAHQLVGAVENATSLITELSSIKYILSLVPRTFLHAPCTDSDVRLERDSNNKIEISHLRR